MLTGLIRQKQIVFYTVFSIYYEGNLQQSFSNGFDE